MGGTRNKTNRAMESIGAREMANHSMLNFFFFGGGGVGGGGGGRGWGR